MLNSFGLDFSVWSKTLIKVLNHLYKRESELWFGSCCFLVWMHCLDGHMDWWHEKLTIKKTNSPSYKPITEYIDACRWRLGSKGCRRCRATLYMVCLLSDILKPHSTGSKVYNVTKMWTLVQSFGYEKFPEWLLLPWQRALQHFLWHKMEDKCRFFLGLKLQVSRMSVCWGGEHSVVPSVI